MAAADQPNGTRASRLAQVIKAKYDAGLLKPYDYAKGYERMNKWMESGRAAPRMDSRAGSEIPDESPQRSSAAMRNGRLSVARASFLFSPIYSLLMLMMMNESSFGAQYTCIREEHLT